MLCLSGFELYSRWVPLETSRKVKALVRLACVTAGVSAAVLGRRVIELRERCALSFCLSFRPL